MTYVKFYLPIAAFTSTGSDSGENWLSPAAFTALTLNTYFSPVVRPWQMNLWMCFKYDNGFVFIYKLLYMANRKGVVLPGNINRLVVAWLPLIAVQNARLNVVSNQLLSFTRCLPRHNNGCVCVSDRDNFAWGRWDICGPECMVSLTVNGT